MTPVLTIAYYFPPIGGAGVQRSVKFVRHLPALGFPPVVLTGPGRAKDRWTPEDASLAAEVPPEVPVHRVELPESPSRRQAAWCNRLGLEGPWDRAWRAALVPEGERIGREAGVRLVFATMSPFSSARAAGEIARRLGVPWVADLRDPWALDEMRAYPSAWHRASDRRRMGRDLAGAACVIMNTPEARTRLLAAFPRIEPGRVAVITNGYDAADFDGPVADRRDGVFTIVHSGYLHTEMGASARRGGLRAWLGGIDPDVGHLARSHAYLLQALEAWGRDEPAVLERVKLVLVGALTPGDRALIDRSPAGKCVEAAGYLPHAESVRRVRSADLLFLPLYSLPPGRRAGIVPGKAYEYIASGRRILAALPEGDARDFVEQAGTGLFCRPDDVGGMVRCLKEAFAAAGRGERPGPVPAGVLQRFERRELSRQLAEVFRRAVERGAA